MIKIISNGSKWYGQEPDTIEQLLEVLKNYPLDPMFEEYGNFISNNPNWFKKEAAIKHKGCSKINGNFSSISHAFDIITDDQEIIKQLTEAIEQNKNTEAYKKLKKEYYERKEKEEAIKNLFNRNEISMQEMYNRLASI
jgi:hypothetical protein